jgi:nitrous oxide reductase accessory protein NosL
MRRVRLARGAVAAVLLLLGAAGCARRAGPPAIADGTPCAACGMAVHDFHFACELETARGWRVYDSIECLLRDAGPAPSAGVYLSDYDRRTLHRADSLWVVKGRFPTPMGGGLAAFLDRASAEAVAGQTLGRVGRIAEFRADAGSAGVAAGSAKGDGS